MREEDKENSRDQVRGAERGWSRNDRVLWEEAARELERFRAGVWGEELSRATGSPDTEGA